MQEVDFLSHRIWSNLSEIEAALESFSQEAKSDIRFDDIKRKADYLKWTLETSDPFLLSDPELMQIRNDLQNMQNHLASDAANFQHLPTISNIFASIFTRLPYPRLQKIFKSDANSIINDLRERASEIKREMQSSLDTLRSSLDELSAGSNSVHLEIGRSKEGLARLDAQVETKLDNWESQFESGLSVKLAEITATYTEFEAEKIKEFRPLVDELRVKLDGSSKRLDEILSDYQKKAESLEKYFIDEIGASKREAQKLLSDIAGIYSVAAQSALSGGFVEASLNEKTLYEDNAWYAKGFFIAGALSLAGLWLYHVVYQSSGFIDILMRIPISIALFVPAIYFSSLAGKHRKTAVALQSLGLRIKAFDAYLMSADTAQKKSLRSEMANIFFDDARTSLVQAPMSEKTIDKITDRFGSIVQSIVDKTLEKVGAKPE